MFHPLASSFDLCDLVLCNSQVMSLRCSLTRGWTWCLLFSILYTSPILPLFLVFFWLSYGEYWNGCIMGHSVLCCPSWCLPGLLRVSFIVILHWETVDNFYVVSWAITDLFFICWHGRLWKCKIWFA